MAKEKPEMKWNEDAQQWDRNEAYSTKIFLEAFENHIVLDAKITFQHNGQKIKARCEQLDVNLQFPRHLRRPGRVLIADVIKAKNSSGKIFYRYFVGSIREGKEVIG